LQLGGIVAYRRIVGKRTCFCFFASILIKQVRRLVFSI
jgi:hypothetical protein